MISDQGGSCGVEAGSGDGHRGALQEKCARASSREQGTALSDRVGGPLTSVQARTGPFDAVQSRTAGLFCSRKRASRLSIWRMSAYIGSAWLYSAERGLIMNWVLL